MKTNKITIYSVLAVFMLTAVFTGLSCKKLTNATDGAKLIIDYNLIKTTIDVSLYDAKTGELIGREGDKNVRITVTGSDKGGIIDATGMQPANQQYSTQRGMLGLAIVPDNQYAPTAMRPVAFNVVASLDGYLATSQHVSISAPGKNFVRINMVDIENPPAGVTVGKQDGVGNVVGGSVLETVTVSTPGSKAVLTLPAGVVLRDADGNPLEGSLNVLMAHFDNTVDEAMAAFPGGAMSNVTRADGTNSDGMFFSAGFVSIEIRDAAGRQAKTIENGTLELVSVVSPLTYNPEAQRNILAGDAVPVWSFDEATGMWTEEDGTTIVSSGGNLQMTAQLAHLSYFNFDWFWTEYCTYGAEFHFELDNPVCDCFPMYGVMKRQSDNAIIKYVYFWVCGSDPVYTFYAPANLPVYIEWDASYSPAITIDPGSQPTYIENLCSSTPVTVILHANIDPQTTTVTADISAYCASQPDVIIRPSFSVWFHKEGDWNWRYASMTNGYAEICGVEIGATYYVFIYYNGSYYYEPFVVTQASYEYINYELPADVCSDVFGL
ncbi:MAG: hypothetical protein KKD74_01065 [Bacteroidetes bacterium]|nr:hypothetical protein [Bacteroidota bacterium]